MCFWADFYARLFNFREIRYFDIQGEYTGLTSKAMTAPDGKIRIPLNEESSKGSGQIEEFLMQFQGEGIQHVALLTDDLLGTIDKLALAGVPLLAAPNDVYYEQLEKRLPGHGERVGELQTRGILLDGNTDKGRAAPAAADLLAAAARPGVLRVHPAKGRRRLRRGQLQGAVPVDRAGPGAARRARRRLALVARAQPPASKASVASSARPP